MPFDSALQRKIMGQFATGVTVVTTQVEGQLHGITANAVTSVSLDPPLVLVCIDHRAAMLERLRASRSFAMNILSAEQEAISNRFASKGPKEFGDLNWTTAATGAPILTDALAYVDCRVTEIFPGGDHDIFIGQIETGELLHPDALPLLYFAGKYRRLG